MKKLWFSIFERNEYKGNEPSFFNPDDYPFSKIIGDHFETIHLELKKYLESNELSSYFNSSMVAQANTWKTISLKTWDIEIYEHHSYFPKTLQVLKSIPGLVSASFNLLQPNGHIIPHCGDTNGIFRCHMGLSIPGRVPDCGFRVRNEWRSWEEGKLLIFVDAVNHEAINKTNQNRFIFLFDIVRDEFLPKKRFICSTVITGLFLQSCAEKMTFLYHVPLWFRKTLATLLRPLVYGAIPLRNFIFKYKIWYRTK